MKKNLKSVSCLLAFVLFLSSCIGSFSLTNKVKDWNDNIDGKFVNELVFLGLHLIPVYPLAIFADILVLNSIEFWTGDTPVTKNVGETKIVKNSNGEDITITTNENGYTLSNGGTAMNLVFDDADKSWNVEYNNQVNKLMKMVDDNNAVLYLLNGETIDVTLDRNGLDMARTIIMTDYALK